MDSIFLSDKRICVVYGNLKVASFDSVEVFRKDPFLVLFLFINNLLASRPTFFRCSLYSDDLVILLLSPYCCGSHTRSSDLTGITSCLSSFLISFSSQRHLFPHFILTHFALLFFEQTLHFLSPFSHFRFGLI